MRTAGRLRMAFYPLPLSEAQRIRSFLLFPNEPVSALDPCVGDGVAFEAITNGGQVLRYGIELDAHRAEQAKGRVANVLQGNALEVHCAVDSFGILFCNPPYDYELGPGDNRRMEEVFLRHAYRWLMPGGVLVLVIPGQRIGACSQVLATQFLNVRAYSLSEPECVRYKQVVVLGVRRRRRERERLQDSDIARARLQYATLARNPAELPVLPAEPDARYDVPPSGPVMLVYRGLPLDEVEDLLPRSTAYRQAGRILFAEPSTLSGRPLTALHAGHVGPIRCLADLCCKPLKRRIVCTGRYRIVRLAVPIGLRGVLVSTA